MLPIKHILFPVDFSERSQSAVPFVEAMANRFGAYVTLLSVAQPLWYTGMGEPGVAPIIDLPELQSDVQSRVDGAFANDFAGIHVERVARLGDPAAEIVDYARDQGVGLIMMPTHGYGPFRRLLLGSVAAKVLHDAACPVWTGAHMEEPPIREHLACRKVLCAVDRSQRSAPLMEWAAEFCRDNGATLRLVHAIPGIEAWPEKQLDREFEEDLRGESRKFLEESQKAVKVDAPLSVTIGEVAKVVCEEAVRDGSDLIVIGRGSLHETLGRLRTHAHAIIRHAPCPVISV